MINNSFYWKERKENAQRARKHLEEIQSCPIGESIIYQTEDCRKLGGFGETIKIGSGWKEADTMSVKTLDNDSVSAVFDAVMNTFGPVCVLNFASYKHPGGRFLEGSMAQEESLCHESSLYNVLKVQEEYYGWNQEHTNNNLYMNRAIYSKDVVFVRDGKICRADVLTCAAPNRSIKTAADAPVSKSENSKALTERIQFILTVMKLNNVSIAILGAFGCGVFRQDAKEVAEIFKEYTRLAGINNVIYAVPSKASSSNYDDFISVINR